MQTSSIEHKINGYLVTQSPITRLWYVRTPEGEVLLEFETFRAAGKYAHKRSKQ